ncbi:hypothetical protein CANINC_001036 [Pichia inconspicua]|uniref:Uncharacterized protein n=1 Tax=Pichia inconspicua TaxID=52247 RepID=A0A4T0X672_9ASCO|nr:hypothetical protein CANINC_001036 [[Candida] inconspicua]
MSEKGQNIILKLGSRTIECGLEGSHQPLVVYNVHHFAENQNMQVSSISNKDELTTFKTLFYPNILVYENEEIFKNNLQNHLRKLLTKIFYKSGISTINAKLLLISNNTLSEYYIDLISLVLLNHFMMRAVVVLPTPLMVSIASGSSSAIVVDFGWEYINIDVIFDNRILQNYSKFTTKSGRYLHYNLLEQLKVLDFDTNLISFKDIEIVVSSMKDIINLEGVVCCGPNKIKKSLISNIITSLLLESDENFDDDNEKCPVQLIVELIERELPLDLRTIVSDRLILTGGLFEIEGVEQIMIENLNSNSRFNFNTIHSLGSFAGASLYSTLSKQLRKNQNLKEYRK